MQPTGDEPLLAGRYRLISLLGRGGMADVYDAFDQRLDRPVAVKILRHDMSADRGREQRFAREARSAARLSHRGVVAIYDSGTDQGRAYLVMERLPGDTLSDRMRAGPIDPRWLAARADEVLDALGAAHDLGMVHRDIKPANILLTEDGKAKLADFGIAKTYGGEGSDDPAADLTDTGIVLGTVAYLSPEQIHGDAASPRSDIYALGVVLYEALAGRKPYQGPNAVAQAHAAVTGGAPEVLSLRPELDPGLAAVVARAMAANPDDRYASAADMRAALAATGFGAVVPAGSEPTMATPAPTAILPRIPSEPDAVYEPTRLAPLVAAPGSPPPPVAGAVERPGVKRAAFVDRGPPRGHGPAILGIVAAAVALLAIIGVVTYVVYNHEQTGPKHPVVTTTTTLKPASSTTASASTTTAPAATTTAAPTTSATTATTTVTTTTKTTVTTKPVTTTASSVTTTTTPSTTARST